MKRSTKCLIGHIKERPWVAVKWKACRSKPIAEGLIELIDSAVFDRDRERALELTYILHGLSEELDEHIECKAEACLATAFRMMEAFDLADKRIKKAEQLAGSCGDCLGGVYKRWGAIRTYQGRHLEALDLFDRALGYFREAHNNREISATLLNRSGVCRVVNRNVEGMENVNDAIPIMDSRTPARYFVAAAVNALSLAATFNDPSKFEAALSVANSLREKIKGTANPRVLGVLRWIRGLAYDQLGDAKNAVRCVESALWTFDRLGLKQEKKVVMADVARIRRKGKQEEVNNRHILRLIEQTLALDIDPKIEGVVRQAKRNPSQENILAWRNQFSFYIPSLEPEPQETAIIDAQAPW